jgi:high-affinity nickel permease
MSTLAVLLLGFLPGIKHASETDHLAAVVTLVTRATLGHTLRQGIAWGIGHTLTLTLIGAMVLALGRSLPPRLANSLELAVGMMYGMASSAALIVLALGSVRSWTLGLLYIAVFGLASILRMPLRLTARVMPPWHQALTALVGVFSCGLGAVVIYRIGFAGGLLMR